jgi:hypothetical protein
VRAALAVCYCNKNISGYCFKAKNSYSIERRLMDYV